VVGGAEEKSILAVLGGVFGEDVVAGIADEKSVGGAGDDVTGDGVVVGMPEPYSLSSVLYGEVFEGNVVGCYVDYGSFSASVDNGVVFVFSEKGNVFVHNYAFMVCSCSDEDGVSITGIVNCFLYRATGLHYNFCRIRN